MSIWGCGSPATSCQPSATTSFIYCRSQEWALHSPSPAGFVYLEFSWMHVPFVFSSIQPYPLVANAVLFYLEFAWGSAPPPVPGGVCHTLGVVRRLPISKHNGGGGTTPAFSDWFVYLQIMWWSAPPLHSGGTFHTIATVKSFPHSKVAGWGPPLLPSLASLFIYRAKGTLPSLLHVLFVCFFQLLVYYSVIFFFFLGGGQSIQGAMLICPREYHRLLISSPGVLHLPSRLEADVWWHGSPPGFSVEHGVGMLCVDWGCGGVGVLPLLGGFSCQVYLQRLSKSLL
jgi:hypothetical protein